MAEAIQRLVAAVPRQRELTLVHGDFRADNLTIENDHDEAESAEGNQALALYLDDDRAVIDDARILADQDIHRFWPNFTVSSMFPSPSRPAVRSSSAPRSRTRLRP